MDPGPLLYSLNHTTLLVKIAESSRISLDRGTTMMVVGLALMGLAMRRSTVPGLNSLDSEGKMALDRFFQIRMLRRRQGGPLFKGGPFDYKAYNKVRRKFGWAGWPVYLMWAVVICGIGVFVAGDQDNTKTAIDFLREVQSASAFSSIHAITALRSDHVHLASFRPPHLTPAYTSRCTEVSGKVERSHKTDSEEFCQGRHFKHKGVLARKLKAWETEYNEDRPHL